MDRIPPQEITMKEIVLTQGKVALVDDRDFGRLNKFKWLAHETGNTFYAERMYTTQDGKRHVIGMHRLIINTPNGLDTDHINGNGLDNRRINLRSVTHRKNLQNIRTEKTSKYPGVCWRKRDKKWQAQIKISGRVMNLGCYPDEETAGLVYVVACETIERSKEVSA
jgi:AP2 domain